MKLSHTVLGVGTLSTLMAFAASASAQTNADGTMSVNGSARVNAPTSTAANGGSGVAPPNQAPPVVLPPSVSDNDARPAVATPTVPVGGVISQAGIGGTTGYGRVGVIELGGSIGLTSAGNLLQFNIEPSVGWFFVDNLQLSARVGFNYSRTGSSTDPVTMMNVPESSAAALTVLIEPSYHLPFNRSIFAFLGLGMGLAYASGPGAGFAFAPRLGMNFMLGRSGILTPSFNFAYSTSRVISTSDGVFTSGNTSLGFNVGYTIML